VLAAMQLGLTKAPMNVPLQLTDAHQKLRQRSQGDKL
jgi:hypothetical protein